MSNFTNEQLAELERLGVTRDTTRQRESRFSAGEDAEMRHTALNLDFNERQRRELAHRFRRRLLPIVGYVVLALSTAYGLQQERSQAARARQAVAAAAIRVQEGNCIRGNALRGVLRSIVAAEIPRTNHFVKIHTISAADGQIAVQQIHSDLAKLADVKCKTTLTPLARVH